MRQTDYSLLYKKVFKILSEFTPISADCGTLCDCACCKGDEDTGMLLFPFEETTLEVKVLKNGQRLAICNGSCERSNRPLSCRIFPFFPTVDSNRKIKVHLDMRAFNICPLVCYAENVKFDKRFLKSVKKVGNLLKKDAECLEFLKFVTAEIDLVEALNNEYTKMAK